MHSLFHFTSQRQLVRILRTSIVTVVGSAPCHLQLLGRTRLARKFLYWRRLVLRQLMLYWPADRPQKPRIKIPFSMASIWTGLQLSNLFWSLWADNLFVILAYLTVGNVLYFVTGNVAFDIDCHQNAENVTARKKRRILMICLKRWKVHDAVRWRHDGSPSTLTLLQVVVNVMKTWG